MFTKGFKYLIKNESNQIAIATCFNHGVIEVKNMFGAQTVTVDSIREKLEIIHKTKIKRR